MSTGTQVEVVMPQMGVSVSEGTITKWLKQPGEQVARDEPLLEISTDKVDTEVPSPGEGVLAEIVVQEGETVEVGTVIARIGAAGAEPAEPAPAEPVSEPAPATAEAPSAPAPEAVAPEAPPAEPPTGPAPAAPPATAPPVPAPVASGNGKTFVSPVVARIASEHGVDPSSIPGTGAGGRVTKKDILAVIESGAAAQPAPEPAAPPAPAPSEAAPPAPEPVAAAPAQPAAEPVVAAPAVPAAPVEPAAPSAPAPSAPSAPPAAPPGEAGVAPQGEQLEPVTAMRRGIAEHMRRSLDTSAHVTSAIEVDMSRVVALRQKLKPAYERDHSVNLTYLSFVARAVVETLKDYPWINGELRGDQIVTRSFVNLGFAVELADGKGLIVPVLRNAETLNLLGIAKGVVDLAQRARDKKLLPDEVQGGTFTITNPGGYGTFHGTPVISQPQAAILGTYALMKRPWVVQDELGSDVLAIRPIMNLTLTYDHRLVDGALAGRFLRDLREKLETWDEAAY
ncbi:MAG TPA: dihydrolipoamide acetyltransferase family protein [Gaiellaceae bacterium]|nr:dihydrolipoamide acetyltransferase family protein [Gaiellaceae bacterium]